MLSFDFWSWGVGGKANGYSLQIEMCEDKDHNPEYFKRVLSNTIQKVTEWCKKFSIPIDNFIGHYEAYLKKIGSNHGDPRHWWSKFGYTMDMFRADVQSEINESIKVEVDKPIDDKICTENLNLRYGPGTNFRILDTIPMGTKVDIYSISGTWAKVKHNGLEGYCNTTFLKEFIIGYVTVSVLNVRAGESMSHPIIKQIRKGDPVTIYGLKNGWWETPVGYVSVDWISLDKVATRVLFQLSGQ